MQKNLTELLSNSTAYGLPKLFQSNRFVLKLFWLSFLLFGSIASIYYVFDAVNSYLDFDVITKIESVYEQPMPFPTISFCPYYSNRFDKKPLNEIVKDCWFNLDRACLNKSESFFERFQTFRGDCFRFNGGKNESGHLIPILNLTVGGKDDSI